MQYNHLLTFCNSSWDIKTTQKHAMKGYLPKHKKRYVEFKACFACILLGFLARFLVDLYYVPLPWFMIWFMLSLLSICALITIVLEDINYTWKASWCFFIGECWVYYLVIKILYSRVTFINKSAVFNQVNNYGNHI